MHGDPGSTACRPSSPKGEPICTGLKWLFVQVWVKTRDLSCDGSSNPRSCLVATFQLLELHYTLHCRRNPALLNTFSNVFDVLNALGLPPLLAIGLPSPSSPSPQPSSPSPSSLSSPSPLSPLLPRPSLPLLAPPLSPLPPRSVIWRPRASELAAAEESQKFDELRRPHGRC